jgi:hypothetical protein
MLFRMEMVNSLSDPWVTYTEVRLHVCIGFVGRFVVNVSTVYVKLFLPRRWDS